MRRISDWGYSSPNKRSPARPRSLTIRTESKLGVAGGFRPGRVVARCGRPVSLPCAGPCLCARCRAVGADGRHLLPRRRRCGFFRTDEAIGSPSAVLSCQRRRRSAQTILAEPRRRPISGASRAPGNTQSPSMPEHADAANARKVLAGHSFSEPSSSLSERADAANRAGRNCRRMIRIRFGATPAFRTTT